MKDDDEYEADEEDTEIVSETIQINYGQGVTQKRVNQLIDYYENVIGSVTLLEEEADDDNQILTATMKIEGTEIEDLDIVAHEITDDGKYDYEIL